MLDSTFTSRFGSNDETVQSEQSREEGSNWWEDFIKGFLDVVNGDTSVSPADQSEGAQVVREMGQLQDAFDALHAECVTLIEGLLLAGEKGKYELYVSQLNNFYERKKKIAQRWNAEREQLIVDISTLRSLVNQLAKHYKELKGVYAKIYSDVEGKNIDISSGYSKYMWAGIGVVGLIAIAVIISKARSK